jgi:muramoyltetrapeptide carboxypeptidase
VWDDRVHAAAAFTAGSPETRAASLNDAVRRTDVDVIVALRGGYGSVHVLPFVDTAAWTERRTAFTGYSDLTSLHTLINQTVGLVSLHGPMIDRKLSGGPEAYDPTSFLTALLPHPVGELSAPDSERLQDGPEVAGPMLGGTLTQLCASLGTPFAFDPPQGHILFLDDVGERPYKLDRMLTQLKLAGIIARASAIVCNRFPGCDEPGGGVTAVDAVRGALHGFPGPIVGSVPSGHDSGEIVTLPFGVGARVIPSPRPRIVIEEAAADA